LQVDVTGPGVFGLVDQLFQDFRRRFLRVARFRVGLVFFNRHGLSKR
jgi:hypothetical protein